MATKELLLHLPALFLRRLNGDWKFDPDMWKASQARHGKTNYAKVFKLFDAPRLPRDGAQKARRRQVRP
jgi:hypothetical protein